MIYSWLALYGNCSIPSMRINVECPGVLPIRTAQSERTWVRMNMSQVIVQRAKRTPAPYREINFSQQYFLRREMARLMDAQWAAVSASDKAQCDREAQARNSGCQAAPLPSTARATSPPVAKRGRGRPRRYPSKPADTPGRRVRFRAPLRYVCRPTLQMLAKVRTARL